MSFMKLLEISPTPHDIENMKYGASYHPNYNSPELMYVGNDLRKMCEYLIQSESRSNIRVVTKGTDIGSFLRDVHGHHAASITKDRSGIVVAILERNDYDGTYIEPMYVIFTNPLVEIPQVIG